MQAAEPTKSIRKPTNLSLDSALLKEAKVLGINVSRSAEAGIAEAVKLHKQKKWLEHPSCRAAVAQILGAVPCPESESCISH